MRSFNCLSIYLKPALCFNIDLFNFIHLASSRTMPWKPGLVQAPRGGPPNFLVPAAGHGCARVLQEYHGPRPCWFPEIPPPRSAAMQSDVTGTTRHVGPISPHTCRPMVHRSTLMIEEMLKVAAHPSPLLNPAWPSLASEEYLVLQGSHLSYF